MSSAISTAPLEPFSPGEQGSNGAVAMALEMAEADPGYYMPYQYGNPANPDAHYHGTAVEIGAHSRSARLRAQKDQCGGYVRAVSVAFAG